MARFTRSAVRLTDEQRRQAASMLAEHGAGLWRIAVVVGGSAQAAEDLLATALLRALPHLVGASEARPQFDTGASGPSDEVGGSAAPRIDASVPLYLRRVMLNLRASEYRRTTIARIEPGAVPDRPDHRNSADAIALRADVAAALSRLAPRQRAVVVLRYLEDRSTADTAAILGCTEETVRSQAHRALARLRADAPGLLTEGPETPAAASLNAAQSRSSR